MKREELQALLRHQRDRGPLPGSAEGLSAWIGALQPLLPAAQVEVPPAAVSPLRALGVVVEEREGRAFARFPADGDALDRALFLLGAPPLPGGAAAALLQALERGDAAEAPPPLSLPLRIQPAKASALGWSPELFSLTVLISNVTLRRHDAALLCAGKGPVVAVCAEYDRALTSLDPPDVAGYALDRARDQGMPMLRLPAGWLKGPLRLEATSRLARAPAGRCEALARAGRFLGELDDAWQRRSGPLLEVAWPVYRPARSGPLLDAVVGRPLPAMELG